MFGLVTRKSLQVFGKEVSAFLDNMVKWMTSIEDTQTLLEERLDKTKETAGINVVFYTESLSAMKKRLDVLEKVANIQSSATILPQGRTSPSVTKDIGGT